MFLLILLSSLAFGDEIITYVKEGEKAPYNGVLYNDEATAALDVKLRFSQDRCQLEVDKAVKDKELELGIETEVAKIARESCEDRYLKVTEAQKSQIDSQQDALVKSQGGKFKTAPFVVGVTVGVATSVLSAYAYSHVEKSAN